jgi:hypothetical protein
VGAGRPERGSSPLPGEVSAPGRPSDFTVVSDVPGRLRLRLPDRRHGPELARRLRDEPGVLQCQWSPQTRGLLVTYRPADDARSTLVALVAELTGTSAPVGGRPLPPDPGRRGDVARRPAVVQAIAGTLAELDASLMRATQGALDLRTAIPIILGLWAVAEILRGRAHPIAWSTALWYAHGILRDYTLPPERDRS